MNRIENEGQQLFIMQETASKCLINYDLSMGTFNLQIDGIWYEDLPFKMSEGTDRTLQATISVNGAEILNGLMEYPFTETNFGVQISQKIKLQDNRINEIEIKELNCESEVANSLFDYLASQNRSDRLEVLTIDKMNPIIQELDE